MYSTYQSYDMGRQVSKVFGSTHMFFWKLLNLIIRINKNFKKTLTEKKKLF